MNILLFEYLTGGGPGEGYWSSPELTREGEIMLTAQIEDLTGMPLGVMYDRRLPLPSILTGDDPTAKVWTVDGDFETTWLTALDWSDAVWVTAPETGQILAHLSRQVIERNKRLLGSHPQAIDLTADKLRTLDLLDKVGVNSVPTWTVGEFTGQVAPPWVVKPRDGVGCEGMRLISELSQLNRFPRDWLLQPFLEGESLSISAIFAEGSGVFLCANRQRLQNEGGAFRLLGCEVNAFQDSQGYWQKLCDRIAAAVPNLWGYAGVDVVISKKDAWVLEINPRLTLSYAGASKALGEPLGEWIVALGQGDMTLAEIARRRSKIVGKTVWVKA